ncbi:MAG TPA: hypothetical protein VFF28_03495 [Candidatus Nanoarchaeia archaeon]|nr:hypothetical protein [Candidatus Nanoarchaeia archaeon]
MDSQMANAQKVAIDAKFILPGAENFSAYLEQRVGAGLTVTGPEMDDGRQGAVKRWIVLYHGEIMGEYLQFNPGLEYRGRIPGYNNDLIRIANLVRKEELPEDIVCLSYGPSHDKADEPWQRLDGHDIPFP